MIIVLKLIFFGLIAVDKYLNGCFTFSLYEKVLVLREKSLSEFSSNLYVLRPPESEKTVFRKVSVCLIFFPESDNNFEIYFYLL